MEMEQSYLEETFYFDHQSPVVREFVGKVIEGNENEREKAVKLFYAVRDGWYYSPELHQIEHEKLRASALMGREVGHCLDKAVMLIASYRAVDLPARLHLVKVRNHIAAEKMIEKLGSDELTPHAFVEVQLEGEWVSVTPAFNRSLCEKLDVDPLEFDGYESCLFQQFSRSGNRFMEYLADYGTFPDYPYDFVKSNLISHYPPVAALYPS